VLVFVLASSAPVSLCYCACAALRAELGMGAFQFKSQRASELWPDDLGGKDLSFSRGDLEDSARVALYFGRKVLHFQEKGS